MQSNPEDLTPLLRSWVYDAENAVRRIKALDGREVLQVRLPLGVEQYEVNGRPDGLCPMRHESWLDYYKIQAEACPRDFALGDKETERLSQEGLLYYHRYLLFFQMQEYALCERDTGRNLKLLEFVSRFASAKGAEALEQYRPYILRMNVMARALLCVKEKKNIPHALGIIEGGIKAIEALPPLGDNQVFAFERARSLQSLSDLHGQLAKHVPLPEDALLERRMQEAVLHEKYEEAATLRDKIKQLRQGGYKTQR